MRPEELVSSVQRPPLWLRGPEAHEWFDARSRLFAVMAHTHFKLVAKNAKSK